MRRPGDSTVISIKKSLGRGLDEVVRVGPVVVTELSLAKVVEVVARVLEEPIALETVEEAIDVLCTPVVEDPCVGVGDDEPGTVVVKELCDVGVAVTEEKVDSDDEEPRVEEDAGTD